MNKLIFLFMVWQLSATIAGAQQYPARSPADGLPLDSLHRTKNQFMVIGTLSVGLPTGPLADVASTAIYVSSGIEYRATKHLTLIGMSEVWSATVELPPTVGQPYAIRGRSNNLFLSVNAGYYHSRNRWTVYGLGGVGAGLVSKPNVERIQSATFDVAPKSEIQPIWRVGVGTEYRISNTLVPYIEGAYASTFSDTMLGERKFTYVSVGLGVKAYLKLKGVFSRN